MVKKRILEKKRQSLMVFLSMLRRQRIIRDVERAYLYGSAARGDVGEDSDVDVLLFTRQPKKVVDRVADASYETLLQTGDRIEAFVYPSRELRQPSSYFLVRVLKEGKIISI